MLRLYLSIPLVLLVLSRSNQAVQNERLGTRHAQTAEPDLDQIRSPLMQLFPHRPNPPTELKNAPSATTPKTTLHLTNHQITQPVSFHDPDPPRTKRQLAPPGPPEPQNLVSSLPLPDPIRGPMYKTYPVKEFDVVDIDDPDDPRRRRIDSSPGADDSAQRDKRTFLEEASGETTTPLPFWKRKKESPPFVTGRAGSGQSGSGYTPAQHRSGENSRESHSLKNVDKTLQSNEISRSNQDNYYSSTNRRTYGRQYDGPPTSTPKSVYDSIDYGSKRNAEPGRGEFARNQEDKKEAPRETRPRTHDQYYNRQYTLPWAYDRPYYQPAYPYPTDILGRGVEYYHRTYDPTTGRIVYYANMPDQGRSHDINRSFYLNTRPYPFDPYYRNYVPPFDYRFVNAFPRSGDYTRTGRSGSQAYSHPYQERDKFPRDARFIGGFDTGNRFKEDSRNKTYIIYDADDGRSHFARPHHAHEDNRLAYTPAPGSIPSRPQLPFKHLPFPPPPLPDFFPAPSFPNRNHPEALGPIWAPVHRTLTALGSTDSTSNSSPPHSPQLQLPLTAPNTPHSQKPNTS